MKHSLSLLILLTLSSTVFAQEEKPNEVFTIVEVPPEYKGGMAEFYKYIMNNMQYPADAREAGIEGKVYIQFVIDTLGAVVPESVKVQKGVHESLDQEAVRLLTESPDWRPGRLADGKPAKVRMIVPITFKVTSRGKKNRGT